MLYNTNIFLTDNLDHGLELYLPVHSPGGGRVYSNLNTLSSKGSEQNYLSDGPGP